jgi:hypothetical protein
MTDSITISRLVGFMLCLPDDAEAEPDPLLVRE